MLVLSRKVGEKIVIDDDTIITVVEVKGNRVRLGVDAPKDKRILRQELIVEVPQPAGDLAAE
jgi:carbon storage regulator